MLLDYYFPYIGFNGVYVGFSRKVLTFDTIYSILFNRIVHKLVENKRCSPICIEGDANNGKFFEFF